MKSWTIIKNFGFTLAEVLITLLIIGVVAEITIPPLINDFQTNETVTSFTRIYSILDQAYKRAVQDNGTPDNWNLTADASGAVNLLNIFAPYLKITKNCGCPP